jgi:hypothetical protein
MTAPKAFSCVTYAQFCICLMLSLSLSLSFSLYVSLSLFLSLSLSLSLSTWNKKALLEIFFLGSDGFEAQTSSGNFQEIIADRSTFLPSRVTY